MIDIQLLGPLLVRVDGVPVTVGGPRRRSTLIRLLLAGGRVVPVDTLIDDIWGDAAPPTARNTLQGYVSGMRKVLGAGTPIVLDNIGYRIQVADEAVDICRFERLVADARATLSSDPARALCVLDEASALWHGPPLADVADEGWARGEVARLEELAAVGAELRAEAYVGLGRDTEAISLLEGLLVAHPYRENLTALLARSLYRAGRQTDALRAIDSTADRLRDELGLSPGPVLLELQGAILRHDPSLSAVTDHPPGPDVAGVVTAPVGATPVPSTDDDAGSPQPLPIVIARRRDRVPLVGRAHELEALRAAWDATATSHRIVVVVEAEAGTGKTRLAIELTRQLATDGVRVLWGKSRMERDAPYATLADMVAARLDVVHPERRAALLDRYPVLGRLVPERCDPGIAATTTIADASTDQRLLTEAVAAVAGGPKASTLLVLDDIQWIDQSSLDVIDRLVHNVPRTARLLVVATRRTVPVSPMPGFDRMVIDLQRDGVLRRVRVAPFTESEVVDFIAAMGTASELAGADAAHDVHRITSGNAFFVEELLRHATVAGGSLGDLPQTVQEAIGLRLTTLDRPARELVEFGAALGSEFAANALAALVERPVPDIVEPLDAAIRAGLLRDAPTGLVGFAHSLARSAVLGSLTPMRRAGLHLRIAEWLETSGGTRHELAHHLERAGSLVPRERLRAAVLARGAEYLAQGAAQPALDDADALLGELSPDDPLYPDALGLQSTARRVMGDGRGARESAMALVAVAERRGDDTMLARAVPAMFNAKSGLGINFGAPDPYLAELIERLLAGPSLADDYRAQLLVALLVTRSVDADPADLQPLADEALEMADRLGTPDEIGVALVGRRIALWTPERFEERAAVSRRAVDPAARSGRIDLQLAVDTVLIADMLEAGEQIDDALAAMQRRLDKMPLSAYLAWASILEASWRLLLGDVPRALELADDGLTAGGGVLGFDAELACYGIHVLAARDLGTCDQRLGVPPLPGPDVRLVAPRVLAALASAELGDQSTAAAVLAELVTPEGVKLRPDPFSLAVLTLLAELAARQGDAGRSAILAAKLLPFGGRLAVLGLGACTGPVWRSIAIAEAAAGDLVGAARHLDAAIEQCRSLPAPIWLERCLHERAALAR